MWVGRAPAGALGEGGAVSSKAPRARVAGSEIQPYREARRGWVWPARRSIPTLGTLVGVDREDSFLIGGWAAPGAATAGSGSR